MVSTIASERAACFSSRIKKDQIRYAQKHPFRKLTMGQTYSIFNNLWCSLGGEGFPLRLSETTLHHLPAKDV